MQPNFTPEEIEKHVIGLDASEVLIKRLISENVKNDETIDSMSRNIRHIEIMLGFDSIANSDWDLRSYAKAVNDGKAWLTA